MREMVFLLLIFLLFVSLGILIKRRLREKVALFITRDPVRLWLFPFIPISIYSFCSLLNGTFLFPDFITICVYFFFPMIVVALSLYQKKSTIALTDIFFILLLWLPIEFKEIPINWVQLEILKRFPIVILVATPYLLILATIWKKIDFFCDWKINRDDIKRVGIIYLFLLPLIGSAWLFDWIDFGIKPRIMRELWTFPFFAVGMFFLSSVPQMVLFFGLIRGCLPFQLSPFAKMIIIAILFGSAHLNETLGGFKEPNWQFAILAFFAAFGFMTIYRKRRSAVAAAILHTAFNLTWMTFFAGKG